MSIQITDKMERTYEDAAWDKPAKFGGQEFANIREGLTAVLNLPEVRDAIYTDVRREVEAKEFDR